MIVSLSHEIQGTNYFALELSELLGRGANARIYRNNIEGIDFAIKVYDDSDSIEIAKLKYMISNPPEPLYQIINGVTYPRFAWPLSIVYSHESKARAIGYVMPIVNSDTSHTLDHYFDHLLVPRLKNIDSRALSFRVEILLNLSRAIADLHANEEYVVDLKPQNILVSERTNIVSLLDCDSFAIRNKSDGTRFKASMVSPDYIAPEVGRRNTADVNLGEEQDRYALAVLIFQTLNGGIHPFQGTVLDPTVSATTNDDKATLGLYAYGLNSSSRITPHPKSIHRTFLHETRVLLDRSFSGPYSHRPSANEWVMHLETLLNARLIVRCIRYPASIEHMRFKGHDCPKCLLEDSGVSKNVKQKSAPSQSPPNSPSPASNSKGFLSFALSAIALAFFVFVIVSNFSSQNGSSYSGGGQSQNSVDPVTLMAQDALCSAALNSYRDQWNSLETTRKYVAEAERRNYTVSSCRIALGLRSSEAGQNQPGAPTGTSSDMSGMSEKDLCNMALDIQRYGWDQRTEYQSYVLEASRRGYSIQRCWSSLGLLNANTFAQLSDSDVCKAALSWNNLDWDTSLNSAAYLSEAKRRGLSINACRKELGLPAVRSGDAGAGRISIASQSGWNASYDPAELTIDPGAKDVRTADGNSYLTTFRSNSFNRFRDDFVLFFAVRRNEPCRSPMQYFDVALRRSRVVVQDVSNSGNSNFDIVKAESYGFRRGKETEDMYVRDLVLVPKDNRNTLMHIGARFRNQSDVVIFDRFISSVRITSDLPFSGKC